MKYYNELGEQVERPELFNCITCGVLTDHNCSACARPACYKHLAVAGKGIGDIAPGDYTRCLICQGYSVLPSIKYGGFNKDDVEDDVKDEDVSQAIDIIAAYLKSLLR